MSDEFGAFDAGTLVFVRIRYLAHRDIHTRVNVLERLVTERVEVEHHESEVVRLVGLLDQHGNVGEEFGRLVPRDHFRATNKLLDGVVLQSDFALRVLRLQEVAETQRALVVLNVDNDGVLDLEVVDLLLTRLLLRVFLVVLDHFFAFRAVDP